MFELLLFALAGGALVAIAIYGEMRQRGRTIRLPWVSQGRKRSQRYATVGVGGRSGNASRNTQVTRAQREKLVRLLRGDRAAAQRLVANIQDKNPERSERWCWEKAIYDIERDRRRN